MQSMRTSLAVWVFLAPGGTGANNLQGRNHRRCYALRRFILHCHCGRSISNCLIHCLFGVYRSSNSIQGTRSATSRFIISLLIVGPRIWIHRLPDRSVCAASLTSTSCLLTTSRPCHLIACLSWSTDQELMQTTAHTGLLQSTKTTLTSPSSCKSR